MDSGLPVKDVGLSVKTGLSYSEDDYQGLSLEFYPILFFPAHLILDNTHTTCTFWNKSEFA